MKKASIIIVQLFCLVVFLSFTADAQSNCTYTVNPNSFVVPISGGDYSLDITTQAGCPWTVTPFQSTRPPSISFTSPTSGTGSGKVDFTIAPNTTPSIREGGIAVKSPDFSTRASVEIVQDVQCADPMFSPSVVNVPGEGATQLSFGWSPSSINCSNITVRSNDSWITLTGMSPEQRYTFSVAPNTGPARTGTISIIINTRVNTYQKIGTLTVNQAAGQSNCTYTLNPTGMGISSNGGDRSFTVTTQEGCSWTATSNQSWITITSGSSGIGSGTVNFRVGMNSSSNQRGGNITVNDQVFLVVQQEHCLLGVEQRTISVPSSGGSGSIRTVPAAGNCGFSYSSNDSWIISSGSGAGIDYILYRVEANTGAARTGTITVNVSSGEVITITINQAAGQSNCTFSVSPTNTFTPAPAATILVNVTTQAGCSWNTVYNDPWITAQGGSNSGTGSGQVTVLVSQNTGPARTGTITIAGQTLTINQGADQSNCTYSLNPTEAAISAAGGSASFTINTQAGCDWRAISNNESWLRHTQPTGNGTYQLVYTVEANTGAARQGTISVSGQTFTVNQAAGQSNCTYTLTPNSTSVTGGSGTASFNVITQSGCTWTANTFNSDWITITSGSSGVGDGTVNFSYTINTLSERRFGSIKVADQTFTLVQDRFCNLANMNSFAGASSNGGLVTVSHLINCTFTVTTDSSWITIPRPLDGPSFGVSFRVNPNPGPARTGTVTVKILNSTSPEETKTITVTQAGSCINSLSSISINIGGSGGDNFGVPVSAPVNCSWEATTESSWIQITRSAGSGNGVITFIAAPNTGQARTGTIIINGQTFTVNQTTAECTYSLSPTSVQAGAAGGETGFNITTGTGCNWAAASNANWITVSNTTGSGAGRINYSVQPNTGQARTGTITAGNQTFTVNQDAVSAPVELIRASGRVIDANFKSIRGAIVSFTNLATGETRTTITNHFGYFHFANIERGQPYSIAISHKRYKFTTRTVIYNTGALIPIYNPDPEP